VFFLRQHENTGINDAAAFFELKTEHSVPNREQHGKLGHCADSIKQDHLSAKTFSGIFPHENFRLGQN
tara:strand:- start:1986 stop:2189 length:204 start_codon:yes stop_codon:yes gene_type:complete